MSIDPKLLEILACPQCKGELEYQEAPDECFQCHVCHLRYAVEDGIPNFLIDEAQAIPEPG